MRTPVNIVNWDRRILQASKMLANARESNLSCAHKDVEALAKYKDWLKLKKLKYVQPTQPSLHAPVAQPEPPLPHPDVIV